MDKSWMSANRMTDKYPKGVESFITFALEHGADPTRFICPCKNCHYSKTYMVDVIREHLISDGINLDYKVWKWHGEKPNIPASSYGTMHFDTCDTNEGDQADEDDRMDDMLHDAEAFLRDCPDMFDNFVDDAQKSLYADCMRFTRLSTVLKLYNLKVGNRWTDKSFNALLLLLREMLPNDNCLPSSTYEAKKLLRSVGMDYQRIHTCPNDCILYRKEYELLDKCPKHDCNHPRYKKNGAPFKVVWYFPIRPRFRRLFGNSEDAKNLTWHVNGRTKDGKLRHPADAAQWKRIDSLHPEFGYEDRNLRLALSTKGMNPHGNLSSSHSTWPVELVIYNLSLWLCMKRKYMMLSLLIYGPNKPGNDIDVYLAPLIEDLKDMWENGIEAYDAHRKENFHLRAMLFCTINDFPAYGNLAGYSIKGYKACHIDENNTHSIRLPASKKNVYMGHRRFLPMDHRFRRLRKAFNGSTEEGSAPVPLSGAEVLAKVKDMNVTFGKKNQMKQVCQRKARKQV